MSDTSTLLLVIMAAVLVSMVLAIVIVRRSQVRASRALADLGAATLTTAATGMGMSGVDAPPLRGTGTLALTDTDVAFAQWRPEHLLRIPRSAITRSEEHTSELQSLMRISYAVFCLKKKKKKKHNQNHKTHQQI